MVQVEASNTVEVTFVVDKETDNYYRLVADDKSGPINGSLYVRKEAMPTDARKALVTVVLE